MSSAWPPAWLAAAAEAERWNAETLPQIKKTLDKLGVAELERRGNDVCVFGGHCEPIEASPSLPVLAAVAKLLKAERKRRNAGQRQKPKRESDFAAVTAEEQLAHVLGPDWRRLGYGQLGARVHRLEQAATFARTLAAYMDETDAGTAGEALDRLQASRAAAIVRS